jgi:hypothetical protein
MPKLNPEDKDKFFHYLKEKGKLEEYQLKHSETVSSAIDYANLEKLLDLMVADLVEKTGRKESVQMFQDYILTFALGSIENILSESEKAQIAGEISESETTDEYLSTITGILMEYKYTEAFITGLAFFYAKLAYKLQVEPNPEYVPVVEVLELIRNLK